MNERLVVPVPDELKATLDEIADKEERPLAYIMRELIVYALEAYHATGKLIPEPVQPAVVQNTSHLLGAVIASETAVEVVSQHPALVTLPAGLQAPATAYCLKMIATGCLEWSDGLMGLFDAQASPYNGCTAHILLETPHGRVETMRRLTYDPASTEVTLKTAACKRKIETVGWPQVEVRGVMIAAWPTPEIEKKDSTSTDVAGLLGHKAKVLRGGGA